MIAYIAKKENLPVSRFKLVYRTYTISFSDPTIIFDNQEYKNYKTPLVNLGISNNFDHISD